MQKLKEDEDASAQMKKRNEGIEHEVERIKERQKIEEEVYCYLLPPECR